MKVGIGVKSIRMMNGDDAIVCRIDGLGAMKSKTDLVEKAWQKNTDGFDFAGTCEHRALLTPAFANSIIGAAEVTFSPRVTIFNIPETAIARRDSDQSMRLNAEPVTHAHKAGTLAHHVTGS